MLADQPAEAAHGQWQEARKRRVDAQVAVENAQKKLADAYQAEGTAFQCWQATQLVRSA